MSHHVSPFMAHTLNLARSFDEAIIKENPEVTIWFKTEAALNNYCIWLWGQFHHNLLMPYAYRAGDFSPPSFRSFQLLGIKYTLEVEPDPKT